MRLKEFQAELKKKNIDFALFMSLDGQKESSNILYFTGYTGIGFMIVPTTGKPLLVVPQMELTQAKQSTNTTVIVAPDSLIGTTRELLKKLRLDVNKVGIEEDSLTILSYRRLRKELPSKFCDISRICKKLRRKKTREEIDIIKEGCKITEDIFRNTFRNFKRFKTESNVSAFMQSEALRRGFNVSYKPIIASGRNSCKPHHNTSNSKLGKGFCIIDFGIRYKGYCTDITRMVYIGSPSKKEIEEYAAVLSALESCEKKCSSGMSCKAVFDLSSDMLGKYVKNVKHSLGHGLGIDIHETPQLNRRSKESLEEGDVFTIEPGIYFSEGRNLRGIRIEDDYALTEKGVMRLSGINRNLLVVK